MSMLEFSTQITPGLAPIILALGALLILMLDVFIKTDWPRAGFTACFALLVLGLQLAGSCPSGTSTLLFGGFLYADGLTCFMNCLIAAILLAVIWTGGSGRRVDGIETPGEYQALLLLSAAGATVMASAAELITLFLGLELMSLSLYCLCAISGRRQGAEGALKYFILGSYSSAFFLFGMALLYGVSGSTFLVDVQAAVPRSDVLLLRTAMGFILFGLAFKVALVPFHFWAPDAYQGAPLPVTAFMACAVKAAAFAAAIRFFFGIFPGLYQFWSPIIWLLALLSMLGGNLIALRQRSITRMLAFSSIAHAGYIMTAFLAPAGQHGGAAAVLYYLCAYTLSTLGAFAVLYVVSSAKPGDDKADDLSEFYGLGYSQPMLAFAMSLFLLSLAGLPPGMAGLIGKFYVFNAAIKAGYTGLVIAGVIGSAISCGYYLRVIVLMYFAGERTIPAQSSEVSQSLLLRAVVLIAVAGIIILGVLPGGLYNVAAEAVRGL